MQICLWFLKVLVKLVPLLRFLGMRGRSNRSELHRAVKAKWQHNDDELSSQGDAMDGHPDDPFDRLRQSDGFRRD